MSTLYRASCRAVDVQHLSMRHIWSFTTEVNHCDLSRLVFHGRIWSTGLKVVVGGWDVTPQDLICTNTKVIMRGFLDYCTSHVCVFK